MKIKHSLRHAADGRGDVPRAEVVPSGACDKLLVTELVFLRAVVMLVSEDMKIPMVPFSGGSCVLLKVGAEVVFVGGRWISGGSVVVGTLMSAGSKDYKWMLNQSF